MLKNLAPVFAGIGLVMVINPQVTAQTESHHQIMESEGFILWNSGEMGGIAFDVWIRTASTGGGFYYFLWEGNYGNVVDTGDPEVVVFFDSNVAQVSQSYLKDCYNSHGSTQCENSERKPVHYRYEGNCTFPWQVRWDGGSCGDFAEIVRLGAFPTIYEGSE